MPNEYLDKVKINGTTYDVKDSVSGYLTSETDPTVPSWAKASSKPSYTASEVGAASSTHTHGDITNAGDITATATIASGDRIIINDESASKVTNSSITFGTSTSQYLSNKGTWENTPAGVPTGGTTGQFLVKASNTNYDVTWVTVPNANGVSF